VIYGPFEEELSADFQPAEGLRLSYANEKVRIYELNLRKLTFPEEQVPALLVPFATVLGLLLRLALPLSSSFPLNDGGLFYAMIRDLQTNGYALPVFSSYNSAQIPFAYPPLAFYITGLLADLTNIPLLDMLRLLPAIVQRGGHPGFLSIIKRVPTLEDHCGTGSLSVGVHPASLRMAHHGRRDHPLLRISFRTINHLLARRLYLTHSTRFVLWTSVWGALTVLSIPKPSPTPFWRPLSFISLAIAHARDLLFSSAVAGLVILFSAPWWSQSSAGTGLIHSWRLPPRRASTTPAGSRVCSPRSGLSSPASPI